MNEISQHVVTVFPITATSFGLRANWFVSLSPKLIHPAYLLIVLFLVISVALLTLNRFENADFEKKAWNIPVILGVLAIWPTLVLGLKGLVDSFNTFLIVDIFNVPWHGFGFVEAPSWSDTLLHPTESFIRLLPNLAYWVIYTFYIIFFFFYSVLGPLVLAKGVLFDEMRSFFDLLKELTNLLLWQTTIVILVVIIMPDIVSGKPLPSTTGSNMYLQSLILGILLCFVPTLTRKFALQIESSFVPLGFKWGGGMLGISALSRVAGGAMSFAGTPFRLGETTSFLKETAFKAEEFKQRYERHNKIEDLSHDRHELSDQVKHEYEREQKSKEILRDPFLDLSKKAKEEMKEKVEEKEKE